MASVWDVDVAMAFLQMAWKVTEFLTRHGKCRQLDWYADTHFGKCEHRYPCACCIARSFDCDVACKSCLMAWRLSCVNHDMLSLMMGDAWAQPRENCDIRGLIRAAQYGGDGLRIPYNFAGGGQVRWIEAD